MVTCEYRFRGHPSIVGKARSTLRGFLGSNSKQILPQVREDAELILSELATNAIVHSRSGAPGGHFKVVLRLVAGELTIAVTDAGASSVPRQRPAQYREPQGRGLEIVSSLASTWWTSTRDGRCTVVAAILLGQGDT